EATGLVRVGELAQADLPETIGVVDVVAVVAVALLHPERAERLEPGMPETEILSGLPEVVVDGDGPGGWNVDLVSELADVGDPDAEDLGVADPDVANGPVGERLGGDVRPGHPLEDLPRVGSLQVDLGQFGRHVGD